jgi:hypothetical protein
MVDSGAAGGVAGLLCRTPSAFLELPKSLSLSSVGREGAAFMAPIKETAERQNLIIWGSPRPWFLFLSLYGYHTLSKVCCMRRLLYLTHTDALWNISNLISSSG